MKRKKKSHDPLLRLIKHEANECHQLRKWRKTKPLQDLNNKKQWKETAWALYGCVHHSVYKKCLSDFCGRMIFRCSKIVFYEIFIFYGHVCALQFSASVLFHLDFIFCGGWKLKTSCSTVFSFLFRVAKHFRWWVVFVTLF